MKPDKLGLIVCCHVFLFLGIVTIETLPVWPPNVVFMIDEPDWYTLAKQHGVQDFIRYNIAVNMVIEFCVFEGLEYNCKFPTPLFLEFEKEYNDVLERIIEHIKSNSGNIKF